MYLPINDSQNDPLCRLELVVEKIEKSTKVVKTTKNSKENVIIKLCGLM